jgi:uncharacterized protein YdaU (DUF1376 family)
MEREKGRHRTAIIRSGSAFMMNAWYAHYTGDYGRDTAHLSLVQHGAYRLLLDHYYSTSGPLPADVTALYRICRAFDQAERDAVDHVLSKFFTLQDDGYHNARADMELVRRNQHHERLSNGARKTNAKRWGNRSATRPALASPQPQPQPKKKNPATEPAPPADSRFQSFLDFAYKTFEQKHGQRPTWAGRDFKALSALLASNKGLEPTELERRFRNYLGSTEPFTQKQGDSLAYFSAHTDSFLAGPICAQGKGTNGNAKSSANDAAASFVQHLTPKQERPN